jgi:Tat protein translocase TatB subunit
VGSVGAPEILVIFLVALIVLGPERLPRAARQAGKAIGEFRRVTAGFQDEVRSAFEDDEPTTEASTAAVAPSAVTPSAVAPSAVTPSAVAPSAVAPSAVTPPPPDGTAGAAGLGHTRPALPLESEIPPPPDDPGRN